MDLTFEMSFEPVGEDTLNRQEWLLFDHACEYLIPGVDVAPGSHTMEEIKFDIAWKYMDQLMKSCDTGRYFFVRGFGWDEPYGAWVFYGEDLITREDVTEQWPFKVDAQGPGKDGY